jgi:hypothetical protein
MQEARFTSLWERRRPGRRAVVSPELIPLLRTPAATAPTAPAEFVLPAPAGQDAEDLGDKLSPARGLAIGLALASLMWFLLGCWLWML